MSRHTPERWTAGRTDMSSYLGDGTPVHYVYRTDAETATSRIRILPCPGREVDPTDDALRIVDCVNACAGLEPSAIPALVKAAEDVYAVNSAFNIAALKHALEAVKQQKGTQQ